MHVGLMHKNSSSVISYVISYIINYAYGKLPHPMELDTPVP
ncbi:protein of unknown function [Paenibacillus alvei]|uniref:Uncharacterized protein n=1 Tax=Paenibacillus alvei TaxID=44250 RepID=A0A383RJS6_PAEAL|nr:protein of unknown function [Paenibacillus alvei]